MQFIINAQLHRIDSMPDDSTITDLVQALSMQPDRIALECNGKIVPRAEWPTTPLHNDDRLEIVHFVGGGRS